MEFWETHIRTEFLLSKYRNNLKFLFGKSYVRILKYYIVHSATTKTKFSIHFLLSNGQVIIKNKQKLKGVGL